MEKIHITKMDEKDYQGKKSLFFWGKTGDRYFPGKECSFEGLRTDDEIEADLYKPVGKNYITVNSFKVISPGTPAITPQKPVDKPTLAQTGMTKADWYAKEMREHKVQCLKNAAAMVSAMIQATPAMTIDGIKKAYEDISKTGFDFVTNKDLIGEYTEEPSNLEK